MANSALVLPEQASIHFYFTPHGLAEDAPRMPELIRKADIFAPEVLNWSPEHAFAYEKISKGDRKVLESWRAVLPEGSFSAFQLKSLYNTWVPVVMFDIEEGNPIVDAVHTSLDDLSLSEIYRPDFEDTIHAMREKFVDGLGPSAQQREEHMVVKLSERVTELIEKHPKLRHKDDVSVLVTLGAEHTNVYHQIRRLHQNPQNVTREFDKLPIIYPNFINCMRALQFGKLLTDTMIARSFADNIVHAAINIRDHSLEFSNSGDRGQRVAVAVGHLSLNEIRLIHADLVRELALDQDLTLEYPVISRIIDELV